MNTAAKQIALLQLVAVNMLVWGNTANYLGWTEPLYRLLASAG